MFSKNHGNDDTNRNVRIVAYKLKDIGEGAVVGDIIGEKILNVKLKPYEERGVTQILTVFPKRRPPPVSRVLYQSYSLRRLGDE